MSFSGLKTAVLNLIHNTEQRGEEINKDDLAASFQRTVCNIIRRKLDLAIDVSKRKKIVLAGGVAANSGIRETVNALCTERQLELYMPTKELCTDNAAMVAAQGYFEFKAGTVA